MYPRPAKDRAVIATPASSIMVTDVPNLLVPNRYTKPVATMAPKNANEGTAIILTIFG